MVTAYFATASSVGESDQAPTMAINGTAFLTLCHDERFQVGVDALVANLPLTADGVRMTWASAMTLSQTVFQVIGV